MSSLVERLRVRTDRRPIYSLFDDSDDEFDKKSEPRQENFERIFRPDAKDESCQACGGEGDLLYCESCTYAYHPKCLLPPLKAPLPSSWRCPECVSPLNDIDKILDCEMRPTVADDSDASNMGSKHVFVKQYLVKWKGLSYLHCIWVPEKEFLKAYKLHPRLKTKVNNFHRQMSSMTNSEEDYVAIRSEWTTVDRILACREVCEKWRIRGNQAYKAGNLLQAEDLYTKGIKSVSATEISGSCLEPLLLCYSNRAATRMSLRRMREAISDCASAAALDPHFLKVKLRAANCYLVLGEVEEAVKHYNICLESRINLCLDRRDRKSVV